MQIHILADSDEQEVVQQVQVPCIVLCSLIGLFFFVSHVLFWWYIVISTSDYISRSFLNIIHFKVMCNI